jgi:hypothetical protein
VPVARSWNSRYGCSATGAGGSGFRCQVRRPACAAAPCWARGRKVQQPDVAFLGGGQHPQVEGALLSWARSSARWYPADEGEPRLPFSACTCSWVSDKPGTFGQRLRVLVGRLARKAQNRNPRSCPPAQTDVTSFLQIKKARTRRFREIQPLRAVPRFEQQGWAGTVSGRQPAQLGLRPGDEWRGTPQTKVHAAQDKPQNGRCSLQRPFHLIYSFPNLPNRPRPAIRLRERDAC